MIHALNAKLELIIIRRGQSRLVLTESYHLNDSLKMDECWKLFFYLKKNRTSQIAFRKHRNQANMHFLFVI